MKEMISEIIREEMLRESQKRYYFMSGLPRSGSTVLSSILNQNPRFYSGPSSPVTGLMVLLEDALSNDELFKAYPKQQQAGEIVSNVIRHYYSDVQKPVIIDKNRSWVNRLHYIPGYFGTEAKVICPVRNVDEILASFISMHRRNPYQTDGKINFIDEMLIKNNIPLTDDARCEFIAGPSGILGQSYFGIRDALLAGHQKQLHFVEYDDLINSPEETMKSIYDFLEEEYYPHDFKGLENANQENDASAYGFSDMHEVRDDLSKHSVDPSEILSESVMQKCKDAEFWRGLEDYPTDEQEDNKVDQDMVAHVSPQEESSDDYTTMIGS